MGGLGYDRVRGYCSRKLSYDVDELVALFGLVKVIEGVTGVRNIVRFWRERFLAQVLWSTGGGSRGEASLWLSWLDLGFA